MSKIAQEYTLEQVLSAINSLHNTTNFAVEVARGNVEGVTTITKFGSNAVISTGTVPEDINNQGGAYVAPTAARIHNIVSDSALDDVGSTGMETVLIFGVINDYSRVTETVNLDGTTPVATVNAYRHIHLMQNTTADGAANVGTITATAVTDGTVTCQISAGEGQSECSTFLVPLGFTALIMKIRARMNCATANSAATVGVYTIPFGKGIQLKTKIGLNNTGSSFVPLDYTNSTPFIVTEKSWIRMRCTNVTNNNTSIEGEYDLFLVKNA